MKSPNSINRLRSVVCWLTILLAQSAISFYAAFAESPAELAAHPGPAQVDPWEAVATPGAQHERLATLVGNWDVTVKNWTQPNAAPHESKARSKKELFLGGRFIKEEFEGQAEADGKLFTGFGLLGYDRLAEQYTSLWLDTTTTAMLVSAGKADGAGNTLILFGEYRDPRSQTPRKTRTVYRLVSKDMHLFEIYELLGRREEVKTTEIVYTRR